MMLVHRRRLLHQQSTKLVLRLLSSHHQHQAFLNKQECDIVATELLEGVSYDGVIKNCVGAVDGFLLRKKCLVSSWTIAQNVFDN